MNAPDFPCPGCGNRTWIVCLDFAGDVMGYACGAVVPCDKCAGRGVDGETSELRMHQFLASEDCPGCGGKREVQCRMRARVVSADTERAMWITEATGVEMDDDDS